MRSKRAAIQIGEVFANAALLELILSNLRKREAVQVHSGPYLSKVLVVDGGSSCC